jgi:hypothetical protein
MLGGGGDSLGDHLLCSWFRSLTQHLAPEVPQLKKLAPSNDRIGASLAA